MTYRLEDELAHRRSLSDVMHDDELKGSRRGSASARRSFFRRKKHQRNNSKDSRELSSFSDQSINSDSTPFLDGKFSEHCLSTGSGRHSDAAHEIRLIGCCILLNVVPKTVPLSGSSRSPLNCLLPFGRLASLEAMRLFMFHYFGPFTQNVNVSVVFPVGFAIVYESIHTRR